MKKWKCLVCGEIFEGDAPPERCPVCGVSGVDAIVPLEDGGTKAWKCVVCGQVFEGEEPPEICPVCGAGRSAFEETALAAEEPTVDTQDRFVLIGGGAAAFTCAKELRRKNATASITLLCKEEALPYNRPALSDLIEDGLSLASITLEDWDFYTEKDIQVRLGAEAVEIDRYARLVRCRDGSSYPYTKLLLATGSNCFNPLKPDADSVPVKTLRNIQDAQEIVALAEKGRRAVVVGGGILGIEAAVALHQRSVQVTVVEMGERIMAAQTDPVAAERIAQALEKDGISIRCQVKTEGVTEKGLRLAGGELLEADFVVVSAGVRAETALAKSCGLEVNRGIVVDESLRTSDWNIFAAGDCAELEGRTGGLWSTAISQGQAAAAGMCGETLSYHPTQPATAFEGNGLKLFSVGNLNGRNNRVVTLEDRFTGDYQLLSFHGDALEGALLLGNTNQGAKAMAAVENHVSLAEAVKILG